MSHLEDRLESGTTILAASHDFEVLDRFSPQTVVLVDGRLQRIEAPETPGSAKSSHQTTRSIYLETLTDKKSAPSGDHN